MLLLALPLGLIGCRNQSVTADHLNEYLHPVPIKPLDYNSDPLLQNRPLPRQYDAPRISFDTTSNIELPSAEHVDLANEQTMKYYTTICDVYWKLNWIRKELLHGTVPYNMEDEIRRSRKKLETITHDGNYDLAAEAFDRLEKGLEHLACLRTLRTAHIDDRRVPWETDLTAVQEYLDQQGSNAAQVAPLKSAFSHAGNDEDEESSGLTSRPRFAEAGPVGARTPAANLVLDYETRYHTSPRLLIKREWETAIRKTNRLRDNLYLQNREQNNDGDGTDVSTAVSLAADDPDAIHMPPDAGKSTVAPAEVVPRT